ncbi:hypothetical protein MNBD_BACTEROID02-810 [hydrothermal vent metagenome]|uniref:Uncharacterized protein n=1 Tax=hydrothermal vent metagenome TaxID=652676 RepID=A0A3B0RA56_9ZZZZ
MKKFVFLFTLLVSSSVISQNDVKIDSVFQFYFKVIEIELGKDNLIKYPNLSEEIDLGNGEIGIINKYNHEAIRFFEKISRIKATKKNIGISLVSVVNEEVLYKWKKWYSTNKHKIIWNKRKQKPKISFWNKIL